MPRVHLFITGRVQGVWFRVSTRRHAAGLGLTGWVRNRRDGRVEAVAEGPRPALDALVEWCKAGPDLADVVDVEADWQDATGEFDDFAVLRSR